MPLTEVVGRTKRADLAVAGRRVRRWKKAGLFATFVASCRTLLVLGKNLDYVFDKLMRQSWQGGQFTARRTRGFATDGAHGVTRPTRQVCQWHNPRKN
jgi:hypothetical protein